ncbi:MAG: L,D-transpeptidase/peptidoglycan binding protein [Actinomycetota bacterium]|nr:L,D-transpeptidase/peptidoglycan binding protein [Actinomycetota bacterium]
MAILILGSVAAYAYDSSREDQIANGITVAGVDVGGLSAAKARSLVDTELSEPLQRPVVVSARGRRFTLSAKDAQLRADVGGMVDRAVQRSRGGNMVTRVTRDLGGGEENLEVPPEVSYSTAAVKRLVARVKRSMDRPAQDARLNLPALTKVKERPGVSVRAGELRRRIQSTLTVSEGERKVGVPTKRTEPKVTREQLESKYPKLLVVERGSFKLKLYERLKLQKSYTIAVGQAGFDTPAGLYSIQNKGVNVPWNVPEKSWAGSLAGTVVPGGSPQNPLKARWMGIFDGAGIHGTDQVASLGTRASHGCVRMAIPDVIELYPKVPVKTPVYIG